MGNEESRIMRQQFEQKDFYQMNVNFRLPFENSKVISMGSKICLIQDLNTQDYKQTFVQVDKFLKKMNKRCPEISSFLFISENKMKENIFYLVFEFGTQMASKNDFGRDFTGIILMILKALIFMEGIQLFYPKISLSHVVRVDNDIGPPNFKLINQFCFQETFKFVVEYLLNVEVSEKKQTQILTEMKLKSLSELSDMIHDFQKSFPSQCSKDSKLSNVANFRSFLEHKKSSRFSFREILHEFLRLFDVENNKNKGYLHSAPESHKSFGSQSYTSQVTSEKKLKDSRFLNSKNFIINNSKFNSNPNRVNISKQYRSNQIPLQSKIPKFSTQTTNNNSVINNQSLKTISPFSENKVILKNHKKSNSKKFIIQHKKAASGYFSMNDNRLDNLSDSVRFSEFSSREMNPRTTLQRDLGPQKQSISLSNNAISFKHNSSSNHNITFKNNSTSNNNISFKKKSISNKNIFLHNNTNKHIIPKSSMIFTKQASPKKQEYQIIVPQNKITKNTSKTNSIRNNRVTNRSTLMSHVHEEYNFMDKKQEISKKPGTRNSISFSNPPKINRPFSFSKNYNIAIDPKQKEQIDKMITKQKRSRPITPIKKPSEPLRIARMSENLYKPSPNSEFKSPYLTNNLKNSTTEKRKMGTGLKRSSSSSFIKKENEELKKKQMKRSIYNLQRQKKNDGVKKFGNSKSNQLKLKTHSKQVLSLPNNEFAPRYLDFGDCPSSCYRITLLKSDNNALADKRFFNNPRNFYAPQMLINLNIHTSNMRSNISEKLISGLKTKQINTLTKLRLKSKLIDFENLVDFTSNLKSSVYHNLDALENDFDLSTPVREPRKTFNPITYDKKQVEKIDNYTFKMQGIEFKDLRGQKNLNVEDLKKKINNGSTNIGINNYNSVNASRRTINHENKPKSRAIKRVNNHIINNNDLRNKYKTEESYLNKNKETIYNKPFNLTQKYSSNQPSNHSLLNQMRNKVIRKHGIVTSNNRIASPHRPYKNNIILKTDEKKHFQPLKYSTHQSKSNFQKITCLKIK